MLPPCGILGACARIINNDFCPHIRNHSDRGSRTTNTLNTDERTRTLLRITQRHPSPWLSLATSVVASAAACALAADTYRVAGVHDGDTLRCLDAQNVQHKIRLDGIDAPELGQPFGSKARQHLADFAMHKDVALQIHGRDHYRRALATVHIDGVDVNQQMVKDGFAWHYKRYNKDKRLEAAEEAAVSSASGNFRPGNSSRRYPSP